MPLELTIERYSDTLNEAAVEAVDIEAGQPDEATQAQLDIEAAGQTRAEIAQCAGELELSAVVAWPAPQSSTTTHESLSSLIRPEPATEHTGFKQKATQEERTLLRPSEDTIPAEVEDALEPPITAESEPMSIGAGLSQEATKLREGLEFEAVSTSQSLEQQPALVEDGSLESPSTAHEGEDKEEPEASDDEALELEPKVPLFEPQHERREYPENEGDISDEAPSAGGGPPEVPGDNGGGGNWFGGWDEGGGESDDEESPKREGSTDWRPEQKVEQRPHRALAELTPEDQRLVLQIEHSPAVGDTDFLRRPVIQLTESPRDGHLIYGITRDEGGKSTLYVAHQEVAERLRELGLGARLLREATIVALKNGVHQMEGLASSEAAVRTWLTVFGDKALDFYMQLPSHINHEGLQGDPGTLPMSPRQAIDTVNRSREKAQDPGKHEPGIGVRVNLAHFLGQRPARELNELIDVLQLYDDLDGPEHVEDDE